MKRRKVTQSVEMVTIVDGEKSVEEMEIDYTNPVDTSNPFVLPAKSRGEKVKKRKGKFNSRKKDESRKRRLDEIEAKISRSKQKKLLKIMERKKKKESREFLLNSLMQHQLSTETIHKLAALVQPNKHERSDESPVSKKLSSLVGGECISFEQRKELVQENHYETGSESEDDHPVAEKETSSGSGKQSAANNVFLSTAENVSQNKLTDHLDSSTVKEKMGAGQRSNSPDLDVANMPVLISKKVTPTANRIQKSNFVPVHRSISIEKQRSKLPIYAEEQSIVESINDNCVTIICGETGSGKTTQLPQFLFEAGYARDGKLIGITEPRRIAAISMAARVAQEMNLPKTVSYQIKYEGNRSPETSILFMTDGVLLKEMQKEIMLSTFSVIIIDEAHERSMYSDVLIGLLTRIAPYRARMASPLKLIIMSATLRLDDFKHKRLFPESLPPVLSIDTRQYPVSIHFEKHTPENYLIAAFQKVCEIHEQKGPGTVLVFLSGRLEVMTLLKWLTKRYSTRKKNGRAGKRTRENRTKTTEQSSLEQRKSMSNKLKRTKQCAAEGLSDGRFVDADSLDCGDLFSEINEVASPSLSQMDLSFRKQTTSPLFCLPLYSLLSSAKQQRIFEPVPDGFRMCVIATNVAETSLTIPAVRYVIDSGREKRRYYDPVTGVSQFLVSWISQASADQRAGRAGRVQPGEVHRLYSSAVYSDFEKFSPPEILTKPIDQLVLHLKSMNIVKVANFPFPTPPDQSALEEAEKRLVRLGALQITVKKDAKEARISALGKTLSIFPLAPAFAKILVMANQHSLMAYACCLVAALSVRELLIPLYTLRGETTEETQNLMLEALKQRRSWCPPGPAGSFGDLTVLLQASLRAEAVKDSEQECERLGVRQKALVEVCKLRQQLIKIIHSKCVHHELITMGMDLKLPTDKQLLFLRQIVTASITDNIAKRVDPVAVENAPKGAYECQKLKDYIYIDPSSVLFKDEPDWVLYQEIIERKDKKYMQTVMCVEEKWLPRLANSYCHFKPIKEAEPRYDSVIDAVVVSMKCTFSDRHWPLDNIEQPLPLTVNLYRYFARFFLDGSVCSQLALYADKLLLSPSAMTKSWAKLQPRTEKLLNSLIEHEVVCRKRLLEVWKNKSEYLLDEYLEWLPQFLHENVRMSWPPN